MKNQENCSKSILKKQEKREKPGGKGIKIRYTKVSRRPKNIDKIKKEYKNGVENQNKIRNKSDLNL